MNRDKLFWEKRMMASAAAYNQGYLWFFNEQQNVLMRLNPQNWQIDIICGLQGYRPEPYDSCDRIIAEEDNIYRLDLKGKNVLLCNLKNNSCFYSEIDCHYKDWGNFAGFTKFGEFLYVFPRFSKDITKISVVDGAVLKIEQTYLYDQGMQDMEEVFWGSVQEKNYVWLFSRTKKIVLQYDMSNDTAELRRLPNEISYCIDVVRGSDDLYILDGTYSIYRWNMESNQVELQWKNTNRNMSKLDYHKLVMTENRFIIMPALGKDILIVNRANKEMTIYETYPDDFQYISPSNWSKYLGFCEDDKRFYFPMRSANYLLTINKEDGTLSWHKPYLVNATDYITYMDYEDGVTVEDRWSLEDFLLRVLKTDRNDVSETLTDLIGDTVYRCVLQENE